jgi:hypothetical protein
MIIAILVGLLCRSVKICSNYTGLAKLRWNSRRVYSPKVLLTGEFLRDMMGASKTKESTI